MKKQDRESVSPMLPRLIFVIVVLNVLIVLGSYLPPDGRGAALRLDSQWHAFS